MSEATLLYLWLIRVGHNKFEPLKFGNDALVGSKSKDSAMALYIHVAKIPIILPEYSKKDIFLARVKMVESKPDLSDMQMIGALLFIEPDCQRAFELTK